MKITGGMTIQMRRTVTMATVMKRVVIVVTVIMNMVIQIIQTQRISVVIEIEVNTPNTTVSVSTYKSYTSPCIYVCT